MTDLSNTLALAAGGMQAQATRLRVTSENISNADTPGFHRKTVEFRTAVESGGVRIGEIGLDRSELKQIYAPGHPLADQTGHYAGSNVDLVIEIADAREAQRSYDANLKMFEQARQMSSALMELLRR